MRFVDPFQVRVELPDDWEETVNKANAYVTKKEDEARQKAVNENESDANIEQAVRSARKKAINAKSDVWRSFGKALQNLTNRKCWYCETYEPRSDMPVDHFRPKNRVAECGNQHDGYHWLAFDWKNYRIACTYCNSAREDEQSQGGKQDHFPLVDETKRARRPEDNWKVEEPELLDPCNYVDTKLLTFQETGRAWEASSEKDSIEFRRAHSSIKHYHLDQDRLKRERKTIAIRIREHIDGVLEAEADDPAGREKEIYNHKLELIRLIRGRAAFQTAARVYLRGYVGLPWVRDILERDS